MHKLSGKVIVFLIASLFLVAQQLIKPSLSSRTSNIFVSNNNNNNNNDHQRVLSRRHFDTNTSSTSNISLQFGPTVHQPNNPSPPFDNYQLAGSDYYLSRLPNYQSAPEQKSQQQPNTIATTGQPSVELQTLSSFGIAPSPIVAAAAATTTTSLPASYAQEVLSSSLAQQATRQTTNIPDYPDQSHSVVITTETPKFSPKQQQNPLIYEGLATAPPLLTFQQQQQQTQPDDYYFSSDDSQASGPKSSQAWWAFGHGHNFEVAQKLARSDYSDFCAKTPLLVSFKQRSLCRLHPKVMAAVANGIRMAIDECQSRFATSRWNCSVTLGDQFNIVEQYSSTFPDLPQTKTGQQKKRSSSNTSLNQLTNQPSTDLNKTTIFGDVMAQANREKSFMNAIIAAGIANSITKACSVGEFGDECGCDQRIKSDSNRAKIEWVGCSDDIDFGTKFSRDFTDSSDSGSEPSSLINLHNYEVGRRIFKSTTGIECTCADDIESSASSDYVTSAQQQSNTETNNNNDETCLVKRCWKHVAPFKDIGDDLIRRYDRATHVEPSGGSPGDARKPIKLRPVKRNVRKPKKKDLVFIDESPDFCVADTRLGVLGTQNRKCNSTGSGLDQCKLLCCGRGYQTIEEEIDEDCECKFVWCCQVKCKKCKAQVLSEMCN